MTFDKNWLTQTYSDPKDIPFLFFWGHQPSKDGSTTKSCFSQWWVAPFEVDGITYPTAEHWMMAGKARLFNDEEALQVILAAETPAKAKEGGRLVRNFDAATWDKHSYDIVVEGNLHKFVTYPELKAFLLNTGNRYWWKPAHQMQSGESECQLMILPPVTRHVGGERICWASH
jgi:ribA/ribD-fused uncharacterized protein